MFLVLFLLFQSINAQLLQSNSSTLTSTTIIPYNVTNLTYTIPDSLWPIPGNPNNRIVTGWLDGTQQLPSYLNFDPVDVTLKVVGTNPISGLVWLQFISPQLTRQTLKNSSVLLVPFQWQNNTPILPIIQNFNYSTKDQLTFVSPAVANPGTPMVYQIPYNSLFTYPNYSQITWNANVKTEWDGQGSDGPSWIRFDKSLLQLQGTPPNNILLDPAIVTLPTYKTTTQVVNGINTTYASVQQRVKFTVNDQKGAQARFNIPILITNGTVTPVPPPVPPPSPPPSSDGPNVGAIVGGVIGGLAAVGLIGGLAYYFGKRNRKVPTDYPLETVKKMENGDLPDVPPTGAVATTAAAATAAVVTTSTVLSKKPEPESPVVKEIKEGTTTTFAVSPMTPPALAQVETPVESSPIQNVTVTTIDTVPYGTSQLDLGPMEDRWSEVVTPRVESKSDPWKKATAAVVVEPVVESVVQTEVKEVTPTESPIQDVVQPVVDEPTVELSQPISQTEETVLSQPTVLTPISTVALQPPTESILTSQVQEPEEIPHPAASSTIDLAALPKMDTPPLSPRMEKSSPRPVSYRQKEGSVGSPRPESAFMASLAIAQMRRTTSVESLSEQRSSMVDPRSSLALQMRGSRTSLDIAPNLGPTNVITPSNAAERAVITTTEEGLPHVEIEAQVGKPFYYLPVSIGQQQNCTYSLVPHGDTTFLDSQSVTSTTLSSRTPRWLRVHYRTGALSGIPYEGDKGETWVDVVRNVKEGTVRRDVLESVKINVV